MAFVRDLKNKGRLKSGSGVLSKAFQGVYIRGNKTTICNVALDLQCEHEMLEPSIPSVTTEVRTYSVQQAEIFNHCYKILGLDIESSRINAGVSGISILDSPQTTDYYHFSVHTTLPTFRCSLQRKDLKLSKSLLDELRKLQERILNRVDRKEIQSSVEDIFRRYGSHVYVGDIQFGGIFSWEASYHGIERDTELVSQNVENALTEGKDEKASAHDTSIDVSFSTTQRGGPRSASSFKPWKLGLESDRNLGTVIDRGSTVVGIWEIVMNHTEEITDVISLSKILFDTWEQTEEPYHMHQTVTSQLQSEEEHGHLQGNPASDFPSGFEPRGSNNDGYLQFIPTPNSHDQSSSELSGKIDDDYLELIPPPNVEPLGNLPKIETESIAENNLNTASFRHTKSLPRQHVYEELDKVASLDILKHLELEKYYPEKISLQDVMEVGNIQLEVKTPKGKVPWSMLQKILMLNKTAVSSEIQNCQTESKKTTSADKSFNWDVDDLSESDNQLHPSDVFMAVFACCDLNLRQSLVQKMNQCRLAVPLLFQDITSEELSYSIWPWRTSTLVWTDSLGNAEEASSVSYPVKVVSCVRLGRPQSSKSKFLNNVISDQVQETFLTEDSPNGNTRRQFTEGMVEASMFLPSKKENEQMEDPTMFLNLRGDGTKFDKQIGILGQISNAVIASIDVSELNDNEVVTKMKLIHRGCTKVVMMLSNKQRYPAEEIKRCLQEYSKTIGAACLKNIKRLNTFTPEREKNVAQITSEARELLKGILKQEKGRPLENAFNIMISHDIIIDEMSKQCQEGRKLADNVMSQRTKDASKEKLLPLQGKDWKEWCKLLKKKKQSKQTSEGHSGILEVGREEQEMKAHRQHQNKLCDRISPFVKAFIDGLSSTVGTPVFDFYIQWLKIYLDDVSRQKLPGLQKLYHGKVNQFKGSQRKSGSMKKLEEQVSKLEQDIDDASLGLEHLMREMGQIYEATTESNSKTQNQFKELPCLAANLLLRGHSLEIMDGDASGVPLTWLSAVFTELEKKLRNERLFTLSVLGIQSSGKSTLLNTMFGLQFPVSAGRCTRGVYMQLVKVKPSAELPFGYVAVLDSEGLRAQELGDSKFNHDNELATFIIGLGNVTLINVKGENVSEIKDILQIVSHAFLRMKMVNTHIQKERACVFVHQNVPAVDAKVKMQSGTRKFREALDSMTIAAAKLENIADIRSFNDVIRFDNQKHVWYFPDLWHGDPPMASVNIGYHERVKDLKSGLLNDLAKYNKCLFSCSQLKEFIRDMWLGVLADDFVFSFRNSIVTKAYKDLDQKFSELKWKLELALKEWISKIRWDKVKTQQGLQKKCVDLKRQVADLIGSKQVEVIKNLMTFIDSYPETQIMQPWKKDKEYALKHVAERLGYRAIRDIEKLADHEVLNIMKNTEQDKHRKEIMLKARQLAEQLKDQNIRDTDLVHKAFENMWSEWINQIKTNEKGNKGVSIWGVIEEVLCEEFPHDHNLLKKELLAAQHKKRKYQDTLAASYSIADMQDIHEKKSKASKVPSWLAFKKGTAKEIALKKIQKIFRRVDSHLETLSAKVEEFQRHEAKTIFLDVQSKVRELNSDGNECFTIPTNIEIRLLVDVARYSCTKFQKMQEYYDSKKSITAQLNDYKQTCCNMFSNVVYQVADELILVGMICDEVEELMENTILKSLELAIVKEIVPHFKSKAMLIKAMLRDLAEKEEFDSYQEYIEDSKRFSRHWLSDYIQKYIFGNRYGSSWYTDQAKISIDAVIDKVLQSIEKTSNAKHSSTYDWINAFSSEVNSFIPFKGIAAASMFKGTRRLVDFTNLKDRFAKVLQDVQKNMVKRFGAHRMESISWSSPPHQQVLEAIWGCEALCPFCEEPCNRSDPNHVSPTDCHEGIQHRPRGVAFSTWKTSKKLVVENCSYNVQTTNEFTCKGHAHKCDETEITEETYHPFKEYKKYVPEWNIPPSPDMDSSHYWMWYLNKFEVQIAKYIKKERPDIPPSWKNITKGSAINSLSLYD